MRLLKAENSKVTRSAPVLITLSFLAVTILLWLQAVNASSQAYREYFDFRVREAVSRIEDRMAIYQQVLHGTRGLYEASKEVSRIEFRDYVFSLNLEDNFPGIQGVGFSLIIPPKQKEAHLSSVRKEGFPKYNIRPEGDRDPFTSIIFLEPLADRNLRAFGYDMFSEPVRREAMERSRDTDKAAMSGKVRLVQESGKKEQAGFLIYLPVYKNNLPHDTLTNRQANIIGWVYSPFRMDDLMEGTFGELSHDIDVEIYDGDQISDESLMYDSEDLDSKKKKKSSEYDLETMVSKQLLNIAGHEWTVTIRAMPSLLLRVDAGNPLPILIIGTAASFLFGWLAWLLITGRDRARSVARKMNAQLIDSEARLQAILDSSSVGVAWANQEGEIEYVNQKFISMFGYTLKDIPTVDQWYVRAYPDSKYRSDIVSQWNAMVERTAKDGSHLPPLETEVTCEDGSVKHVLLLGSWAGTKLLVNFSDITERKKSEMLTAYLAHHDTLTNLANRQLFTDMLEQAISLAKRTNNLLAVLFIDLDKFKSVNDTLGHKVGDILLQETAKRIKESVRDSDVVARMGGDEFLILLNNIENEESARLIAEKIRFILSQPFIIDGQSVQTSASIGIAVYPQHGDSQEELTKNADHAMYEAKNSGRNSTEFFK